MCGIYGFIGKPTEANSEKILKLFVTLGILTEERGTHATGYYGLNHVVTNLKAPLPANEFYKVIDFVNTYKNNIPHLLIGHNRFASHGDPKNNINNHPFVSRRFGFIHNGVVAHVDVNVKTKSECDSEKLFVYFRDLFRNSHKVVDSIANTMRIFDKGSYACAMVDNVKRKLFLFRNCDRSVVYTKLEGLNIVVFASTKSILTEGLKKCKIEFEKIKFVDCGRIIRFDEELNGRVYKVAGIKREITYTFPASWYNSTDDSTEPVKSDVAYYWNGDRASSRGALLRDSKKSLALPAPKAGSFVYPRYPRPFVSKLIKGGFNYGEYPVKE
jgi:predicted glutamine amidotransferase